MVEKASTCTGVPAEEEQGKKPSQLPRIQSAPPGWQAEFILEAGLKVDTSDQRRQTLDDFEISQHPNPVQLVICRASNQYRRQGRDSWADG